MKLFEFMFKQKMVNSIVLQPSGQAMPLVGFGAWKVPAETCANTIYNAIKSGYRLIDGAQGYANEKECGEAVHRAINEGIVKREDIFITSKLWNTFHRPEHVRKMVEWTLRDYKLDYIDLFLIHFPVAQKYVDPEERYPAIEVLGFEQVSLRETWQALEECVKAGLIKNIGISNYNAALIRDLLAYCKVRPSVLQIEHHPYLTQSALVDYCQREGIAVTAYSSFGPQSFIELDNPRVKENPLLLEHPTILEIATEMQRTPAQVLLRWATQRNIAVIPKSNNQQRLEQNVHCTDFELPQEQIKKISDLNMELRFNDTLDWNVPVVIF